MESPARKAYHRINMKLYKKAKMQYENIKSSAQTTDIPKQRQSDIEVMQRVLKSIEEGFEQRPNAIASALIYFKCDDLHIRRMINYVLRLQDRKYN